MDTGEPLRCKCGEQLGEIITVKGMPLLKRGSAADRAAHGVCLCCGCAYHWTTSERQLEALIQTVLEGREIGP